ncbi:MAG TPA: DUF5672 family protein [Steroidobacteraceae bacterium]
MREIVPTFRRLRAMPAMTLADHAVIERPLRLPDVTLVCVDTANPDLGLYAVERSMERVRFGAAVFITRPDHGLAGFPPGLEVVTKEQVRSVADYSLFMLRGVLPYVNTSHCLVIQWDGFVLDPSMWSNDFLRFDYIAAVWPHFLRDGYSVGTGGFSLRSRRLLTALLDERIEPSHPEDLCIGRACRAHLERYHGIAYADVATAHRFAVEGMYENPSAFGFHGVHNLLRVLPSRELDRFLLEGPGPLFASGWMRRFIKHALAQGEYTLARRALVRRHANRKFDLSELRLWLRLYRARCLEALRERVLGQSMPMR